MRDDRRSGPGERAGDDAHGRLRTLLRDRLRQRSNPVVAGGRFIVPAASVWAGARAWVAYFRELGLAEGDRVALHAAPSPAHLMVTVAAWWEGLTLCPVPAGEHEPEAVRSGGLDPTVVVTTRAGEPTPGIVRAEPAGGPPDSVGFGLGAPPDRVGRGTRGIALLLSTSGTSRAPGEPPTRVGLSYANLEHQLRTHAAALARDEHAVSVSQLPWHHAFGLLVDLWPALLNGSAVVVEPSGGRDAGSIARTLRDGGASHASFVPLQVRRLLREPGGAAALRALEGGVVGGARVEADLAEALSGTRLRAGYGQTETSPGICLGDPGRWHEGAIGRPVGCQIDLRDGTLSVRGPNVCAGFWTSRGFGWLDPGRWHDTGDLVEDRGGSLSFVGRADDRFKLENGRLIDTPRVEASLRDLRPGSVPVVCAAGERSVAAVFLDAASPPELGALRQAMGGLGPLLAGAYAWPSDGWLTPKGAPDRARLAAAIRGTAPMERATA